jgi:hypothetical protein
MHCGMPPRYYRRRYDDHGLRRRALHPAPAGDAEYVFVLGVGRLTWTPRFREYEPTDGASATSIVNVRSTRPGQPCAGQTMARHAQLLHVSHRPAIRRPRSLVSQQMR